MTTTAELLKPYQERGARWLAERDRALLGDDPGLGKTRTALAAAAFRGFRRIFVLGPAIARAAWEREFDVMTPLWVPSERPTLMFASYGMFVSNATTRAELKLYDPDVAILDEFHYLKHGESQRTQRAIGWRSILNPVAIWGLSGTPIPRNPLEIYPVTKAFWPKEMQAELGISTLPAWRDKFTVWRIGLRNRIKVFGARNVDALRAFYQGKMLRRRASAALPDLPPIRWTVAPLSVPAKIERAANDIALELSYDDIHELTRTDARADGAIARARHELGDLKAPIAADLILGEMERDPENGKRVVLAYHRSVLDVLEAALEPLGLVRIDGSTPAGQRYTAEREFQDNPNVRVFLGQTEAAGLSITLTAAHRLDLVEPDWRTDLNVQAGKRIHRIGQTRPAWVRMLTMADTLDEAIVRQHHREVAMVGKVLDE